MSWKTEIEYQSQERKMRTGNVFVMGDDGEYICKAKLRDAALIAAAPDMLAALQIAYEDITIHAERFNCYLPARTKNRIKSVIAKAVSHV